MTERKVLIVRAKGGIGDAVTMTRYILNGLSCGVLVLPDEVISYSVEELPVLYEAQNSFTDALVEKGLLDEKYIGKPPADAPSSGLPAVEVIPLGKEENPEDVPGQDKAVEILSNLMYPQKDEASPKPEPDAHEIKTEAENAKPGQITGVFKPKGGQAEIKRDTYARLEQYRNRTGLRWAQRVSDAAGGRVSPDVIRYGLLEARDIGIERWKLIAKALDKLEEGLEK